MITATGHGIRSHVLRLTPGMDVRSALHEWCGKMKVRAACVAGAVGSLSHAVVRMADAAEGTAIAGPLEVLSLQGLLAENGTHLHVMVSDALGQCAGGHLLEGCTVRTTLELVLLELHGVRMLREPDPATGYLELVPVEVPIS